MFVLLLALFASTFLASIITDQKCDCGDNEIYYVCGTGDDCPRCCNSSMIKHHPESYKKKCVDGCRCDKGYAWNSRKQCIPLKYCHVCPGENEEYQRGLSSSCDIPTCSNPVKVIIFPTVCTMDSRSECVCINNTVRHPNGTCVPYDECPDEE